MFIGHFGAGFGAKSTSSRFLTQQQAPSAHLMIIFVSYGTTSCWNKRCNGEK